MDCSFESHSSHPTLFVKWIHAAACSDRSLVLFAALSYITWIDHTVSLLMISVAEHWAVSSSRLLRITLLWNEQVRHLRTHAVWFHYTGHICPWFSRAWKGGWERLLGAAYILFLELDTGTRFSHLVIIGAVCPQDLCSSTVQWKPTSQTEKSFETKSSNLFLLWSTSY